MTVHLKKTRAGGRRARGPAKGIKAKATQAKSHGIVSPMVVAALAVTASVTLSFKSRLMSWFSAARGEPQNPSVARQRSEASMTKVFTKPSASRIPPGSYISETLPPLSPGAQRISDRIAAKIEQLAREESQASRNAGTAHGGSERTIRRMSVQKDRFVPEIGVSDLGLQSLLDSD